MEKEAGDRVNATPDLSLTRPLDNMANVFLIYIPFRRLSAFCGSADLYPVRMLLK